MWTREKGGYVKVEFENDNVLMCFHIITELINADGIKK
jgi:hypothetical protein